MTTIPVFFTFDHHFVLAAGVAFHTLLEKADARYHYNLYVVHTDLKPHHMKRLQHVVGRFPNAEVAFIDASEYDTGWAGLRHKSHFSKEIFYKLTAADLFPQYDRILFSDVDVIFTDDIAPAYFLFPDEKFYYAGTRPIQENNNLPRYRAHFTPEEIQTISQYEISAGFMLINLKLLRADYRQPQLTEFFRRNVDRLILPEQDCIALCLAPDIRFLDYKYVVCASQYFNDPDQLRYNPNNPLLADRHAAAACYRKMLREVVQLHYPGADKPWNHPLTPRFDLWIRACRRAGLMGYYLQCQPQFLLQRLKRYNLRRFIQKHTGHAQ